MVDLYTLTLVVAVSFGSPSPDVIQTVVPVVRQLYFPDCVGLAARYLALSYQPPLIGGYAYLAPMVVTTGMTCLPDDSIKNTGGSNG